MKKRLFLIGLVAMALQHAGLWAQDIELTGTAYEKKEVVTVDGVTAGDLYVRAMEALSDWKGPDGKAEAGLDFHDKDAGVVNYKGKYSLGFKKGLLGDGWYRYADFTLKVKCKDGKAQVTVTVPTVTAVYSKNGMKRNYTVEELKCYMSNGGKRAERISALLADLKETADGLVEAMVNRLKNGSGDDDF